MKKKMMSKTVKSFAAVLSLVALLSGCGNSGAMSSQMDAAYGATSNYAASKSAYQSEVNYEAEYSDEQLWSDGVDSMKDNSGTTDNGNLSNTSASKRKLIKNVNMKVETQEYEILMANIESRVKELGGYIQNMDSYNGSNYSYISNSVRKSRYATMTIRIPQLKLDEFVGSVSDLANVVNRSESVSDVTLQYVDIQSHKESLQVEQKRLLELLERAEYLEDIITLENRLTNIRYQIESMESSLRTFDDQVDYSTVQLQIDEVEVFTPVEEEEETTWERIANGFIESLESVRDGFVEFFVWFIVNIPYLVIWAVVITITVLIWEKMRKKKKAKKLAQYQQQNQPESTETPAVDSKK